MLHINCPYCFSTNRLANERLEDNPKCGKCKKSLFSGSPMDLNPGNVAATLNNNDIPVVVDCWAPWCRPCKGFAPVFEGATREFEPKIRFAKLNTEAVPSIAQRWRIQSIPTLIVFAQGKEKTRLAGALPATQFKQWLAQNAQ